MATDIDVGNLPTHGTRLPTYKVKTEHYEAIWPIVEPGSNHKTAGTFKRLFMRRVTDNHWGNVNTQNNHPDIQHYSLQLRNKKMMSLTIQQ